MFLQLVCYIVIWGLDSLTIVLGLITELRQMIISPIIKGSDYFSLVSNFFYCSKHFVLFWIINKKQNGIGELLDKTQAYISRHVMYSSHKQSHSRKVESFELLKMVLMVNMKNCFVVRIFIVLNIRYANGTLC